MVNDLASGDWIAVSDQPLPIGEAVDWAITEKCGALTTFYGTVRDFSEGREGVTHLDYEAYPEQVIPRLALVAKTTRERWPMIGRIVLLHRTGRLELKDVSVFVAASTPSRPESFEATRFLIDNLKATVPIWKKETWAEGSDWGLCDHVVANTNEGDLSFGQFEHAHKDEIEQLVAQHASDGSRS